MVPEIVSVSSTTTRLGTLYTKRPLFLTRNFLAAAAATRYLDLYSLVDGLADYIIDWIFSFAVTMLVRLRMEKPLTQRPGVTSHPGALDHALILILVMEPWMWKGSKPTKADFIAAAWTFAVRRPKMCLSTSLS